jgi:PIN domain nuclease of toxin-antitoxin system
VIILDTHAWIWFVGLPDQLSVPAQEAIENAIKDNSVLISAISVWEVAMLVRKQRLKLSLDVAEWVARTEALPFFRFVPVDNAIALDSVNLPEPFHQDPADRIITATALARRALLVTKDVKLQSYPHVETIW